MPPFAEIKQLLSGQIFGSVPIPQGDLTGKTIIITGGNTGLGLEAAKHLARLNVSNLILACRSVQKGEAAASQITSSTKNATKVSAWQVDLQSYASVMAFVRRVRSQLPRLDGIILNAGVEMTSFELSEGLETCLTVNDVSTLLMAIGVLPKLKETAQRHHIQANLTFVGSCMHAFADASQFDVPEGEDLLESWSDAKTANMVDRYQLSKLVEHLCFNSLVQHIADYKGVVVNIVNPGWCGTELSRYKNEPAMQRLGFAAIGWTAEKGSRILVQGVKAGNETNGCYLAEGVVKRQSLFVGSEQGRRVQTRVWKEMMERITKIDPESANML